MASPTCASIASPLPTHNFISGSSKHEHEYILWLSTQEDLPDDLEKYPEVEDAWTKYRAAKSEYKKIIYEGVVKESALERWEVAFNILYEAIENAAIDFDKPHLFQEVLGTGVMSDVKKIKPSVYANYLTLKKTLPVNVEDDLKNYPELENALIEYRKEWGALDDTNVADDNLKMAADDNLKASKH